MRRFGTASFVLLLAALRLSGAEGPTLVSVQELSFAMPAGWSGQPLQPPGGVGVVYTAQGPENTRLTVASLPASAAPPALSDRLDPLTAPEIALARVSLEESGLTPVAGAMSVAHEAAVEVTALAFTCAGAGVDGAVTVLTATWKDGAHLLRARLQFPSSRAGGGVAELRRSLQYGGHATLGFGTFVPAPAAATPTAETLAFRGRARESEAGEEGRGQEQNSSASLVQKYRSSLVIVEGGGGAGSGFICRMAEGVYLITNQHVASEMPVLRLTSLDQATVPIGAGEAAVGHDVIRFSTSSKAIPLVAAANVDAEAKIGDAIVVLGNSEGAHVVQPLPGRLVGLGPDRIEVSAEFVPGNSGSPIIHLRSGKVLGIATYLMQRQYAELTDAREGGVRRFGYRLDSIHQWQPVTWPAYRAEATALENVEALTKDLARLIKALGQQGKLGSSNFANSPLDRPVRDFAAAMGQRSMSAADRSRATQIFLSSLRLTAQADIARQKAIMRYDFFQRQLAEQNEIRGQMSQLFDRMLKASR